MKLFTVSHCSIPSTHRSFFGQWLVCIRLCVFNSYCAHGYRWLKKLSLVSTLPIGRVSFLFTTCLRESFYDSQSNGVSFFVVDITAVDGIGYEHYMLVKFAIMPRLIAEAEAKAGVINKAKKTRQLIWAD